MNRIRLFYPMLAVIVAAVALLPVLKTSERDLSLAMFIKVFALGFITVFIISMVGDDMIGRFLQKIRFAPRDAEHRAVVKAAHMAGKYGIPSSLRESIS